MSEPRVIEAAPVTLAAHEPAPAAPAPVVVQAHPEVASEGRVTHSDVDLWRRRYGDSLVAVKDVETVPALKERHDKLDTYVSVMRGLQTGLQRPDIAVEETPALVGLYHNNVDGAPLLDYKPDRSFVRIPEKGLVTDEVAAQLRSTFGMTDEVIAGWRKNIAALRANTEREDRNVPINIFRPEKPPAPRVHIVRDTLSGTTIYALGMLMVPSMAPQQIASIVEEVNRGIGERIRTEEPKLAGKRDYVRCAWLNNARSAIFTFYASLQTPKGMDDKTETAAREIAKAVAAMQLRDAPAPAAPPKDMS